MPVIPEPFRAPVVYALPQMDAVPVTRDLVYRTVDEGPLLLDVYRPLDLAADERRPAVVFVHGDAPPEVLAHAKDWGQYTSWGRLVAVSGFVGITFNHRSTLNQTRLADGEADVAAALAYVREHAAELNVDPERLAIWVCSAGGYTLRPIFLAAPTYIRCSVAYYPVIADPNWANGASAPLLLVRAGCDHAGLNAALDRFVQTALQRNMQLELHSHPTGEHAFDVLNDNPRSRELIVLTLDFLRRNLTQPRLVQPRVGLGPQ